MANRFLPANQGSVLGLSPGDRADLVTIPGPGNTRFTVARKVAPQFSAFLSDLGARGYGIDQRQSGSYNYRNIKDSPRLSQHAYGNAIDLNSLINPRGSRKHNLPADIGDIAAKYGLAWGGTWSNPDPMHFEASHIVDNLPSVGEASGTSEATTNGASSNMPAQRSYLAQAINQAGLIPGVTPGRASSRLPLGGPAPSGGPMPASGPQPLTPPSMRNSRLADALLASAAGANPKGWGDALNALGDLALGYTLSNRADEEQKTYKSQLAERLRSITDADSMANTLMSTGDDDLVKQGVAMKVAQAKENAPLRGKDRYMALPNGQVLDLQTMKPVEGMAAKDDKPIEVNGRLVKLNPQTGKYDEVYAAPPKAPDATEVERRALAAGLKPGTPEYSDYVLRGPQSLADAKPPSGYRRSPDGAALEVIPGGPADKQADAKFSEGAARSANFANMMRQAEKGLEPFTGNPLGFFGSLRESVVPEGVANPMRTKAYQQYRQAAMQWVRAKLRKESGAQISDAEFEGDFRTYFPQYGDDPKVIAQKKAAREQASRGMIAESRGAYESLFPSETGASPPLAPNRQASPPPRIDLGGGSAAGNIPMDAIDMLRGDPSPEAQREFDETFGPGSARRALGR